MGGNEGKGEEEARGNEGGQAWEESSPTNLTKICRATHVQKVNFSSIIRRLTKGFFILIRE